MNDKRGPAKNPAANVLSDSQVSALVGLDKVLEVRERLVVILEAIDQDEIDGGKFYAAGLLEDFDREVQR